MATRTLNGATHAAQHPARDLTIQVVRSHWQDGLVRVNQKTVTRTGSLSFGTVVSKIGSVT